MQDSKTYLEKRGMSRMIDASIFECFKKTPLSPIFIREIGARVNVGLKKQR